MKRILLMTSDPRFRRVVQRLSEQGWETVESGDCSKEPCLVLFALNAAQEAIKEVLERASAGSRFVIGRAGDEIKALARKRGIHLLCLLEEEAYRKSNAQATAEGVLAEILGKTPRLLGECRGLVCGFGTCGTVIARLLRRLGAEVWVKTGERSTPLAREEGFSLATLSPREAQRYDFVVNTVESPLFSEEFLAALPAGCVIFQVASGFSGFCADRLEAQGIRFVPLPGLPGRFAPHSEADCILHLLQLREEEAL
ncbi:MAG: hypothetical protein IKV50_05465 [Clostridia bacterium]|nr:hypothetical protein [Clostridia bacterium]